MGSAHQLFSAHAACPVKSLPREMPALCTVELTGSKHISLGWTYLTGASLVIPAQGGENG